MKHSKGYTITGTDSLSYIARVVPYMVKTADTGYNISTTHFSYNRRFYFTCRYICQFEEPVT